MPLACLWRSLEVHPSCRLLSEVNGCMLLMHNTEEAIVMQMTRSNNVLISLNNILLVFAAVINILLLVPSIFGWECFSFTSVIPIFVIRSCSLF